MADETKMGPLEKKRIQEKAADKYKELPDGLKCTDCRQLNTLKGIGHSPVSFQFPKAGKGVQYCFKYKCSKCGFKVSFTNTING